MKAIIICICAALAFCSAPCLAAESDSAKAEQEIKARAKQFETAWAKHDAKIVGEFYAKDANVISGAGRKLDGRDGIEQGFSDLFAGDLKDSTITDEIESVRLIKPDVAIVDAEVQIKGENGDPLKFHLVSVLVKEGGKWLTQTDRAIVYTGQ